MGTLNVVNKKIVEDNLDVDSPTEEQIIEAVCNAISLGDGLDGIFDIEAERAGKETFMYVTDFVSIVHKNPKYSRKYEDALSKRDRLAQESVHTAMKEYNKNPNKKNYDILKLHVEAAKAASQAIKTSIVIENNQIFPKEFFTGLPTQEILPTDSKEERERKEHINNVSMDVLVTPDEIRATPEYQDRIKRVAGLEPNDAAFWTHQIGGIHSNTAKTKRNKRIAEDEAYQSVRDDKDGSSG